jgi:hypothetical protein
MRGHIAERTAVIVPAIMKRASRANYDSKIGASAKFADPTAGPSPRPADASQKVTAVLGDR